MLINSYVNQAEVSPGFPFALGEVVNCLLFGLLKAVAHGLLSELVASYGMLTPRGDL